MKGPQTAAVFLSIVILRKISPAIKGVIMLFDSLKFTNAEDIWIKHVYFHSFLKTH